MWGWGAWDWVIVVGAYVVGLGFFHVLGGLGAAAKAIQGWGRATSARRIERVAPRYAHLADGRPRAENRPERG